MDHNNETVVCCHKMMYEREGRHELNCNWDTVSISYNVNCYYSVLSLSTPMSASGTYLPACVEWRTAKRERAAWWRWAVSSRVSCSRQWNPCRQAIPKMISQGTGQGEVLANDTSMVVLLQVSLAPPCTGAQVWHSLALPELQSTYSCMCSCTEATVNCSH